MANLCDKLKGSLMAQVVRNLCVDKLQSIWGGKTRLVSVLLNKIKNVVDLVKRELNNILELCNVNLIK